MTSAPSFLQPEPISPSAAATPVLFGGHRDAAHALEQHRGDAEMWEGSAERDADAELFSNLSVTCCMSPTGSDLRLGTYFSHIQLMIVLTSRQGALSPASPFNRSKICHLQRMTASVRASLDRA